MRHSTVFEAFFSFSMQHNYPNKHKHIFFINFSISEKRLTAAETEKIARYFAQHIRRMKTPGKTDCDSCKTTLQLSTDWKTIKYFVYNKIVSFRKCAVKKN